MADICKIKGCRVKAREPLGLCEKHYDKFKDFFAGEFNVASLRLGDASCKVNYDMLKQEQRKTRQLTESIRATINIMVGD